MLCWETDEETPGKKAACDHVQLYSNQSNMSASVCMLKLIKGKGAHVGAGFQQFKISFYI